MSLRRSILLSLSVLLLAACGGSGSHAPPIASTPVPVTTISTPINSTPQAPRAPRLLYVRRLEPDFIFQELTVDVNGGADAGEYIGEIAGVKHNYVRLGLAVVARLRRELRRLGTVPSQGVGGKNLEAPTLYTIESRGHLVRIFQGSIPHRIAPLVADLNALMDRYVP
jgi:hypothetical protein